MRPRSRRGRRAARCRRMAPAHDRPGSMLPPSARQGRAGPASRIAGRPAPPRIGAYAWAATRRSSSARTTVKPAMRLCGKAAFRICAGTGRSRPRTRHRRFSSPRRPLHRMRRRRPPWRCAAWRHRRCGPVRGRRGCVRRRRGWRRPAARRSQAEAMPPRRRGSEHGASGEPRRAGQGRAGPALSLDRTGSNPSRPPSHSQGAHTGKAPDP